MRMPIRMLGRLLGKAVLVVCAAFLGVAAADAENWPARPVTLVVSFAPGALMDFVGRTIANDLAPALGQPVVVENKVGGGGVVATVAVAKAPADGYTLLMTAIGPAVLRPLMEKNLGYDTDADFTPVSLVGDSPNILVASPKLGLNSVQDLLGYIKTEHGKISIGHSGPGTMGHLCALLFASEAKLDPAFVSYRGSAPMFTDLLGGQIDIGFIAYGSGAKAVKILAVTTDERIDFLPGVPTMKESGYDVVGSTWIAIFAPAHTPPSVVAKLNAAIDAVLRKPETRARLATSGFRVLGGAPTRLSETVAKDRGRWAKILTSANVGAGK